MKVWIIEGADHVSDRWHKDGGVVVIARDLTAAMALAHDAGAKLTDAEWDSALVYAIAPDAAPKAFIFPDAGCC